MNRSFSIKCSTCGKKLKVPMKLVGKQGKCPKCKATVKIERPRRSLQRETESVDWHQRNDKETVSPDIEHSGKTRQSKRFKPTSRNNWKTRLLDISAAQMFGVFWLCLSAAALLIGEYVIVQRTNPDLRFKKEIIEPSKPLCFTCRSPNPTQKVHYGQDGHITLLFCQHCDPPSGMSLTAADQPMTEAVTKDVKYDPAELTWTFRFWYFVKDIIAVGVLTGVAFLPAYLLLSLIPAGLYSLLGLTNLYKEYEFLCTISVVVVFPLNMLFLYFLGPDFAVSA